MVDVKKIGLIIWCLLGSSAISLAQRWEIGLTGGISYYTGDLNPVGHFKFPNFSAGLYGKRNFNEHWSVRVGGQYLQVHANDRSGDFDFQTVRNLNFRSEIWEVNGLVEFNFIPYLPGDPKEFWGTPYVVFGVGMYYHNPHAEYNGQLIPLYNLNTEGQNTASFQDRGKYSRFQFTVPFGIGFKLSISDRFSVGLEYSMRWVFTDYLDDVSATYVDTQEMMIVNGQLAVELSDRNLSGYDGSVSNKYYQRGNASDRDWYGYLGVSLLYNIKDPVVCNGLQRKRFKRQRSR